MGRNFLALPFPTKAAFTRSIWIDRLVFAFSGLASVAFCRKEPSYHFSMQALQCSNTGILTESISKHILIAALRFILPLNLMVHYFLFAARRNKTLIGLTLYCNEIHTFLIRSGFQARSMSHKTILAERNRHHGRADGHEDISAHCLPDEIYIQCRYCTLNVSFWSQFSPCVLQRQPTTAKNRREPRTWRPKSMHFIEKAGWLVYTSSLPHQENHAKRFVMNHGISKTMSYLVLPPVE